MLVNGTMPTSTFLQSYTRNRLQGSLSEKISQLFGCMDFHALNFNLIWARNDPSMCLYSGCSDPQATNYNVRAIFDDGTCYYTGCTDDEALNYNQHGYALAIIDDGDYRDDGSCRYDMRGCMDRQAWNFQPNATKSDGSCRYYEYGCKDATATNYDQRAVKDCDEIHVFGSDVADSSTNDAVAVGAPVNGSATDGERAIGYDLCRDSMPLIIATCCTNRGLVTGGNITLCKYPPPPPPEWWEEIDYAPFMWGGVCLGLILLIRWCRRIFKETAEFVAPVSNTEFDALAGRYLPCSRCDSRLAVNVFTLPDGQEEPLCDSCFQRKTRDFTLAMSLLDGHNIQAQYNPKGQLQQLADRSKERMKEEDGVDDGSGGGDRSSGGAVERSSDQQRERCERMERNQVKWEPTLKKERRRKRLAHEEEAKEAWTPPNTPPDAF